MLLLRMSLFLWVFSFCSALSLCVTLLAANAVVYAWALLIAATGLGAAHAVAYTFSLIALLVQVLVTMALAVHLYGRQPLVRQVQIYRHCQLVAGA